MILDNESYLAHYGILRRSGRYPWGSGENAQSFDGPFLSVVEHLRKQGYTESQIAEGFGTTTTRLRAAQSIEVNREKLARIAQAQKLKDKGLSNVAIGEKMGINESSVRSLLAPGAKDKADVLLSTSEMLKRQIADKQYIDIGEGVENQLGISGTKLKTAVAVLEEQGYVVKNVQVDQLGTRNKTTIKVLAPPGTTYRDIVANKEKIRQIQEFSEDGGRTMLGIHPPLHVDSKRIAVRYAEQGGKDADGVIFVRPGVKDVAIGGSSQYAQVRIGVDGTHYLKGMAVYKNDLPPGVDLMFNTNKSDTGNKLDAMKNIKDDPENPFGSIIRQQIEIDAHGKEHVTSALNIVGSPNKEGSGAEGSWDTWSKSLSTQLLSKQSPKLIEQQLAVTQERKKQEFEELKALTNPTVRRELLEKFADGADSSAVHLKAAALPRQATKVLMPVPTLKPTEVYAPSFRNGERVALVRYPHGGTFEIPELVVNNNHKPAQELLGKQALDAIGIHPKVAERLSGADFDGDTVVVIPNNHGHIKSTPALKGLKDFDPQRLYKLPDDAPKMSSQTKQKQMGLVSNLITDMTIKGAPPEEVARAVRHSMVVIDAEKHHLDYKRSAEDNGIPQLMKKYQNRSGGGSSTLISRAKSKETVPLYKERAPKDGGPIDPKTGKKQYAPHPESFINREGQLVVKTHRVARLANTDNAFDLVSKERTPQEILYAEHSNQMKALANEARKEVAAYKPPLVSKSAKTAYEPHVKSLNAKLNLARKNKPLERQAQVFANATVAQRKAANPDMDSADLKKIKSQALTAARRRTGAEKYLIRPSPDEWAAIQAGAVSANQLSQILKSADLDVIRELATPRTKVLMNPSMTSLARTLMARGYTQAEVADHLGVSLTTLKDAI